jgi:hypothetical protein
MWRFLLAIFGLIIIHIHPIAAGNLFQAARVAKVDTKLAAGKCNCAPRNDIFDFIYFALTCYFLEGSTKEE